MSDLDVLVNALKSRDLAVDRFLTVASAQERMMLAAFLAEGPESPYGLSMPSIIISTQGTVWHRLNTDFSGDPAPADSQGVVQPRPKRFSGSLPG